MKHKNIEFVLEERFKCKANNSEEHYNFIKCMIYYDKSPVFPYGFEKGFFVGISRANIANNGIIIEETMFDMNLRINKFNRRTEKQERDALSMYHEKIYKILLVFCRKYNLQLLSTEGVQC